MTQAQSIAGDAGIVASGPVTVHGGIHLAGAAEAEREILEVQRKDLHRLIAEIMETRGSTTEKDRMALWREVHKATGRKLHEMTPDDYKPAVECLYRLLQDAQDERRRGELLDEVLRRTELDETRNRAELFALAEFGQRLFKDLRADQLQALLRFLITPTAVACAHDCASCRAGIEHKHRRELDTYKTAAKHVQAKQNTEHEATITRLRSERDQLKKLVETARGRETQQDVAHAVALDKLRGRWMAVAAMAAFGGLLFGAWAL